MRRELNSRWKICKSLYRQYVTFDRSDLKGNVCRKCNKVKLWQLLEYIEVKNLEEWIQIKHITEWIHHATNIWRFTEKKREKLMDSQIDFLWGFRACLATWTDALKDMRGTQWFFFIVKYFCKNWEYTLFARE